MGTLSEWVSESEIDVTAVFQGYNATEKHFVWTVRVQLPGNPNVFNTPYTCGVAHCKKKPAFKGEPRVKVTVEIAKALKNGGKVSVSDVEGYVVPTPPDAASVMSCLQSDAHSGDETFDDFCRDFGYDNDSRKAEATWRICVDTRARLRKVLAAHYEAFMAAENDV